MSNLSNICALCNKPIGGYDPYLIPSHDGLHISRMKGVGTTFPNSVVGWTTGCAVRLLKVLGFKHDKGVAYVYGTCADDVLSREISNRQASGLK